MGNKQECRACWKAAGFVLLLRVRPDSLSPFRTMILINHIAAHSAGSLLQP
jgi:hypothetical protein